LIHEILLERILRLGIGIEVLLDLCPADAKLLHVFAGPAFILFEQVGAEVGMAQQQVRSHGAELLIACHCVGSQLIALRADFTQNLHGADSGGQHEEQNAAESDCQNEEHPTAVF